MRLNDSVIRAATSGTLWDDLKGFGCRIGRHSKTYVVDIGRGRRKKIGRVGLITLVEARDAAKKILAEKTLGKIVPKHVAFEDAKADFLADCAARLRPGTVRLYTWHLNQLPFGRQSIGEISPKQLLDAFKGMTPSNREHCYRITRTFFHSQKHILDRSPFEKLDPPPTGKVRERVLTDSELRKVYQKATKGSTSLHKLVYLLIRTGQRVGEIKRLKRDFIASDRITLPSSLTKNKEVHVFPISRETYNFIKAIPQLDGSPYLFPPARTHVRGKPVEVMTTAHLEAFRKECNIAPWQLRDIKKTFATTLERFGVPIQVTEAFINHKSGSKSGIVSIYQRHRYFKEMKAALTVWERHLKNLLK